MDMDERAPLRSRAHLVETLVMVLDQAGPERPAYRLVGSAAAVLQGVDTPAGDVDLLVARRPDVDVLAAALAAFPCRQPPTWLPDAGQYFARYHVNGADVEISTVERPTDSDAIECLGSGPWTHYVDVPCGAHTVPVVQLELRLISELVRNRLDRAALLIEHIQRGSHDRELVRRGIAATGMPLERQQAFLHQLENHS
jgi:hypothetical protein